MRLIVVLGLLATPFFGNGAMGEEYLLNASFEEPLDQYNWGCDQPKNWIRWGNWMNRETKWMPVKQGACVVGYHHWRIQGEDNAGFYQDVRDISAGRTCTFAINVWVDDDTNAETIELQLQSLHGGSVLTHNVYQVRRLDEGEWNHLTVTGESPSDGLRVAVIVQPKDRGTREGALKFDCASLKPE